MMQKHLTYIRTQVEAGRYLVVGPMLDKGRIHGIVIVAVPTP